MSKERKIRKCEIVQQLKFLEYPIEELQPKLERLPYIYRYAYAVHDKDLNSDGSLKESHVHIILQLKNPYTIQRVAEDLQVPKQQVNHIKSRSMADPLLYLTHENAPEKHKYDEDIIISNFNVKEYLAQLKNSKFVENVRQALMKDIIECKVKRYGLIEFIEKNSLDITYLIKWKGDIDKAFNIRNDNLLKETKRNLDVIYIYGGSGCGKTTYAKMISEKLGYTAYISSGNNKDLCSGYQDQDVFIIDDPSQSTFKNWSETLKLLDNHTNSAIKSRFYDKNLVMVKKIIITSTKPMNEMFKYGNDFEQKQIKRRINMYFNMTASNINMYAYNNDTDLYDLIKSVKNPVPDYLNENEKIITKNDTVAQIEKISHLFDLQTKEDIDG